MVDKFVSTDEGAGAMGELENEDFTIDAMNHYKVKVTVNTIWILCPPAPT